MSAVGKAEKQGQAHITATDDADLKIFFSKEFRMHLNVHHFVAFPPVPEPLLPS